VGYDNTINRFVYLKIQTNNYKTFERGRKTKNTKITTNLGFDPIIGLQTTTAKNLTTGELELYDMTVLVNLCGESFSSPAIDEYLTTRYYGDTSAESVARLRSARDFENFPVRNYPSKWPQSVTDLVLMDNAPQPQNNNRDSGDSATDEKSEPIDSEGKS